MGGSHVRREDTHLCSSFRSIGHSILWDFVCAVRLGLTGDNASLVDHQGDKEFEGKYPDERSSNLILMLCITGETLRSSYILDPRSGLATTHFCLPGVYSMGRTLPVRVGKPTSHKCAPPFLRRFL